ncbi:unnamed protein product [Sympodiomycopsis kandeliae]
MGCLICLDNFQDDDTSMRPCCLPCGHVYHHSCAKSWLESRPSSQGKCPTCNRAGSIAQLIPLWPADLDDLDRIAARRKDPESRHQAEEQGLSPAEADELLDTLVDFNSAVQSYAVSIHGARAVASKVAGERVIKLFRLDRDEHPSSSIEMKTAILKLNKLIEQYGKRVSAIDKMKAGVETEKTKLAKAKDTYQQWNNKISKQSAQYKTLESQYNTKLTSLQNESTRLAQEQAKILKFEKEIKESREAIAKEKMEMRQLMIQKESELSIQLNKMSNETAEYRRDTQEAVKEREATKEQNFKLADQLRELQKKIKNEQISKMDEKTKNKKLKEENIKLELLVKKLKAQAVSSSSSLSSSIAKPQQSPSAGPSSSSSQRQPLSPSRSKANDPNSSLLIIPQSTSHPDAGGLGGLAGKGDDDDDDDDDDGFPLPGLPASKYKKRSIIDLTHSSSDTDESFSSTKRTANAPLSDRPLNRHWGIVTGPKRKVRG